MAIKMVTCAVCQQEVTKASTLDLSVLGAGTGRACRIHPAVQKLVDDDRLKRDQEWKIKKAEEGLKTMVGAAGIRVFSTFMGLPQEALYEGLRRQGYSPHDIERVKREVMLQGGPEMGQQEILSVVTTACDIRARSER